MNSSSVAGSVLLVLGTAALVLAVLRAVTHTWTYGVHEVWVLPAAGLSLVLLGRLMLS